MKLRFKYLKHIRDNSHGIIWLQSEFVLCDMTHILNTILLKDIDIKYRHKTYTYVFAILSVVLSDHFYSPSNTIYNSTCIKCF